MTISVFKVSFSTGIFIIIHVRAISFPNYLIIQNKKFSFSYIIVTQKQYKKHAVHKNKSFTYFQISNETIDI